MSCPGHPCSEHPLLPGLRLFPTYWSVRSFEKINTTTPLLLKTPTTPPHSPENELEAAHRSLRDPALADVQDRVSCHTGLLTGH